MACCMMGHGATAEAESRAAAAAENAQSVRKPCHQNAADQQITSGPAKHASDQVVDQSAPAPISADCSGCADCALATAAPPDAADFLTPQNPGFDPFIAAQKAAEPDRWISRAARDRKHPRDPPDRLPTPVTLKQRLLA